MVYTKKISVIVPVWRVAIDTLPKLISSIPEIEEIEIIIVDNSQIPVKRKEILSDRDILLLHSEPNRHAGGSRNDGISASHGKWLLFADADDYFVENAFKLFLDLFDTDVEIVYTGMGGIYADTGEKSDRGEHYLKKVHDFCSGITGEDSLRLGFASPCCKMISHDLVNRYNIKFDEIRAGNDIYFSLTSGFYARKIKAIDQITYIATVSRGTLTRRCDYEVIKARLYSKLHCNKFFRDHGYSDRQQSIMFALVESRHFGFDKTCEFIRMIIAFRQNPFIHCGRWISTFFKNKKNDKKNQRYIIKK